MKTLIVIVIALSVGFLTQTSNAFEFSPQESERD
jgi:hypothetical protein